MATQAISRRALGRATLARQLLLARADLAPAAAVERLAGVQAQLARPAFVGLWTRIAGLDRAAVLEAVAKKRIVRATLMRATLHLVSAKDWGVYRAALAPTLTAAMHKVLRDRAAGLDVAALERAAAAALAGGPRTFEELRPALAAALGHDDARALGYAVRVRLPLVQAADGSAWGWGTGGAFALASSYLGARAAAAAERDPAAAMDELVRRYLAAFGPATPPDAATWSGATVGDVRAAFARVRGELVALRGDDGREYLDLPGAPRPGADAPAPVRLLPEWDSLLLGHAERSRVISDAHRRRISTGNLGLLATFLVDGEVAGSWRIDVARGQATLAFTPFVPVAKAARAALEEEARAALAFVVPEARTFAVTFAKP